MLRSPLARQVALAVSLPVLAGLLYALLRRSIDDDDEDEVVREKLVTSRQTVIEVTIPDSLAGVIIGPQGATIKQIQDVCGARINFRDSAGVDGGQRVIVIRASQSNAQRAEMAIHKIIADQPKMVTEVINVPQTALGRIIGRNGDTIRQLTRTSKARIVIARASTRDAKASVQVTLHGGLAAIEYAKGLVAEKVSEDEAYRMKDKLQAAPRRRGNAEGCGGEGRAPQQAEATPRGDTGGDGGAAVWPTDHFEIYLSAVEHPGHFWVQLLNEAAPRLDALIREMSLYYGDRQLHQESSLQTVAVGDVVAAHFEIDDAWYRGRVCSLTSEETVDVYYVDFGDSAVISRDLVRALRSDFLSLPFQAFECSLSGVKPVGSEWSEQAIEMFEQLSHVAKWRVIMAKTASYNRSGANCLPSLQLTDTNGETDVCVADELVRLGLAQWSHDKDDEPSTIKDEQSCANSSFLYKSIQHDTGH